MEERIAENKYNYVLVVLNPDIGVASLICLVIFGIGAFSAYRLYRNVALPRKRSVRSEANRESRGGPDANRLDSDTVFAKDCKAFEQSVNENPQDVFAWTSWGTALAERAVGKSYAESDQLSSLADEKYSAALALTPNDMMLAGNLAGVVYHLGTLRGGSEGRQFLIRACDLCERIVDHPSASLKKNPTLRRHALLVWGASLDWLGRRTGLPDANRFYASAEEKYAAALTVSQHYRPLGRGGAETILHWALQHPGEASGRLLMEACRESESLLRKAPNDWSALVTWGMSRAWLAHRVPDAKADGLYSEVEKRLSAGLKLSQANEDLRWVLAHVLIERAELRQAEDGNEFLIGATTLLEAAVQANPQHGGLLSAWARVLNFRALRMPGEETNRLLAQAFRQFQESERAQADRDPMLWVWGTLLWAQARSNDGEESVRLLQEAERKYATLETWATGSAAYDLACVCAELHNLEECRYWLQESREPGFRISADAMARDAALQSVRECTWFVQFLTK